MTLRTLMFGAALAAMSTIPAVADSGNSKLIQLAPLRLHRAHAVNTSPYPRRGSLTSRAGTLAVARCRRRRTT